MTARLLVIALCVWIVEGCIYSQNPGLFKNGFENSGDASLVLNGRTTDTNTAYGQSTDITFTNDVELMIAGESNTKIRVCDNGVIVLEQSSGALANCPMNSAIATVDATQAYPFIAADAILTTASGVTFEHETYHILSSSQYDASGNASGPSICDLEMIGALVADCEERYRLNITVTEALIVTWKIGGTGFSSAYIFQTIIAVVNDGGGRKTRVAFLYKDRPDVSDTNTLMKVNNVIKGQIHARNNALPTQQRYSIICNAETDADIHKNSNCRCAQPGHYVFDTMDGRVAPHGFCGTESMRDTCTNQAFDKNDGMTLNRNCVNSTRPQDTCDVALRCLETDSRQVAIEVKNTGADRYVFINHTAFVDISSGSTGFTDPHGDNLQLLDFPFRVCNGSISPSNTSYQLIPVPSFTSWSLCGKYDSTENAFKFVLVLYNSATGFNVTTYKSQIYVGHCDFDDLPQYVNVTQRIGEVSSTSLAPRTGRKLTLSYWSDRNMTNSPEEFVMGTTVKLGRFIYIALCFEPGTPYSKNADPYGVYGYDCMLANNPSFDNTGNNRRMSIIDASGCPVTSSPLNEGFQEFSITPALTGGKFCVATAGFKAFRWKIGEKKLYLRCKANFCRNTQLYPYSRCKDSCANTIVDSNKTDVGQDRKRREVGEAVEDVYLVVDVAADNDENANMEMCADPVMAKTVIGTLVALLIASTIMAVILFLVLQSKRK